MVSKGTSRTIFLGFNRKNPGQASCKSQQLPRGGKRRKERDKAMLIVLRAIVEASQTVVKQSHGRGANFRDRREPKEPEKVCLGKRQKKSYNFLSNPEKWADLQSYMATAL